MTEATKDSLTKLVRQYYPAGFTVENDDLSQSLPAHQRTPEHSRFMTAWDNALGGNEWKHFMRELKRAFPGEGIGNGTQPYVSACMRCFTYRTELLPSGEEFLTRVAAAVSVLAPFYIVYVTTQRWPKKFTDYVLATPDSKEGEASEKVFRLQHFSSPQLTFDPPAAVLHEANTLAKLIEEVLGYHRFPLAFAGVPLPDLRVGFFNGEGPPTLLDALFSDDLANLP